MATIRTALNSSWQQAWPVWHRLTDCTGPKLGRTTQLTPTTHEWQMAADPQSKHMCNACAQFHISSTCPEGCTSHGWVCLPTFLMKSRPTNANTLPVAWQLIHAGHAQMCCC